MLVLLFHIGTERWAIAASDIKDVLPFVRLQTFAKGVDSAVVGNGLLNYRGEVLPAVDVSALVAGIETPQLLSTRIAIVEKKLEKFGGKSFDKSLEVRGAQGRETSGENRAEGGTEVIRLGLILDRASEMAQLAEMSSQFSARSVHESSVHESSVHHSSVHHSSVHESSVHNPGDSTQPVSEAGPSAGEPPVMRRTYAKTLLRGQALSLGEPSGAEVVPLLAIDQLSENMHLRGVS